MAQWLELEDGTGHRSRNSPCTGPKECLRDAQCLKCYVRVVTSSARALVVTLGIVAATSSTRCSASGGTTATGSTGGSGVGAGGATDGGAAGVGGIFVGAGGGGSNPCDAAAAARSHRGCEFWVVHPETDGGNSGPCLAAIVVNDSMEPAHIEVARAGVAFTDASFIPVPDGQGEATTYGAYDPTAGLPANAVAVVFLSHQSFAGVGCPAPVAVDGETSVNTGTGRGHAFQITTDQPVVMYSIWPYGTAHGLASASRYRSTTMNCARRSPRSVRRVARRCSPLSVRASTRPPYAARGPVAETDLTFASGPSQEV
jgi:hypothetical protein